jgi:hypothetical protein
MRGFSDRLPDRVNLLAYSYSKLEIFVVRLCQSIRGVSRPDAE